jgi:hypothetical protein
MNDEYDVSLESEDEWEDVEEEIDLEEVERIVATLDQLIAQVQSDTVRESLEVACEEIASLVEWEEEENADQAEAA